MVGIEKLPKAFSVSFQDLTLWNVGAQFKAKWGWPSEVLKPLSDVLVRRIDPLENNTSPNFLVTLLTIHFDGSIETRNPVPRKTIKGKLFKVFPGDVVFSKIDVRNGAIALVPEGIENCCVTSEFPVYSVNTELAIPQYIKLLFRTKAFMRILNSMISGASGRKRIQPSQLESVEIPIPRLDIQHKIIKHWGKSETTRISLINQIVSMRSAADNCLLKALGIKIPLPKPLRGVVIQSWKKYERWDTFFYRPDFLELECQFDNLNVALFSDIAHVSSRPWKRSDFPSGKFRYIEISSVSKDHGIRNVKDVMINNAPSRATTLVKEGDLIISTTRPYLGAFAIVDKSYDSCVCSSGFALIDYVNEKVINKNFLLAFLKSQAGLRQFQRRMTGGLYPAIVKDELMKIKVPIVLMDTQEKILIKIQEVESIINEKNRNATRLNKKTKTEIEDMILGLRPVEGI